MLFENIITFKYIRDTYCKLSLEIFLEYKYDGEIYLDEVVIQKLCNHICVERSLQNVWDGN